MPKTLPSTAVEIIEYFHRGLGIVPSTTAGRKASIDVNDDCAVILSTIVGVVDDLPDELLQVPARERVHLYAAVHALKNTLIRFNSQSVESRYQHRLPTLGTMRWLDGSPLVPNNRYPTEVICDVLRQCPDEAVRQSTTTLPFITDTNLRDSLRLDLSSVNAALDNGEYKAATVLGGSIVEALLLWGISRKSQSDPLFVTTAVNAGRLRIPDPDENKWDLHTFIQVSLSGNLIETETATIALLAKNFRNLIHPGRALRLKQTCDRGTALAALSAVEHVIRDFTNNPP